MNSKDIPSQVLAQLREQHHIPNANVLHNESVSIPAKLDRFGVDALLYIDTGKVCFLGADVGALLGELKTITLPEGLTHFTKPCAHGWRAGIALDKSYEFANMHERAARLHTGAKLLFRHFL